MSHLNQTFSTKILRFQPFIAAVFLVFLLPTLSFALTPIARWDVVPYQRITTDAPFNLGVIAFSKAGIDRISFTVSGQGYTGINPLLSEAIAYNNRTNVYEYSVPLQASDFTSDGAFSVNATVYGKDGDSRTLDTLPLVVNATGNLPQPKAWVSNTGNNGTGAVGDSTRPFATVSSAVSAIQSANGGISDGGIIYFNEGTYNLGSGSITTRDEWLTLKSADGANRENTVINSGGSLTNTKLLKTEGLTLQSTGSTNYIFTSTTDNLWINNCRLTGAGRWVNGSNPVHHTSGTYFSTNNYIHDVDYGFRNAGIVRGVTMERLGNDAFENTPFIVNCSVDDIDNGSTGWHADAYQAHTTNKPPATNRIIYNYRATNLHCEGVFLRSDAGTSTNNAFVNVFVEMREPFNENESGNASVVPFSLNGSWDHLLVWQCSFPYGWAARGSDGSGRSLTNASFIGNLFWQWRDTSTEVGQSTLPYAEPNNSDNNDFLYNHFSHVYGETVACTGTSVCDSKGHPCPQWYAKKPDSHSTSSATTGGRIIEMNPDLDNFGKPLTGSVIESRVPFEVIKIPVGILGNPRGATADVGAMEKNASLLPPRLYKK